MIQTNILTYRFSFLATYSEAIFNEKKKINSSDSEVEADPGQRRRKIIRNKKYRDDSLSPIPQLAEGNKRIIYFIF